MLVAEALEESHGALFNKEQLRSYARELPQLYFYRVGRPKVAEKPVTFRRLATKYNYWPSSNFFPLSETGRQLLDSLGSFE